VHQKSCELKNQYAISCKELTFALIIVGLSCAVRILYALHYPLSNDEPQHLHVIWGWYHGLVQYRDIFDNHMPLFHILLSPLFSAIGERPTLMIWMRLAMLPLFAVIIFCIYVIGASVFSKRVGLWAAVWTAVFPSMNLFIEFRTDILWALCWFSCIAILVSGRLTIRRSAVAGFFAGLTFATSLKTSFLAVALAASIVATILITRKSYHWAGQTSQLILKGCAFIVCLLIPPAVLVAYFYARGATDSMYYCVVAHNLVLEREFFFRHLISMSVVISVSLVCSVGLKRLEKSDTKMLRKTFIMLLAGFSFAMLQLWPVLTQQDYAVILPAFLVVGAALIEFAQVSALKRRPFLPLRQLFPVIMAIQLGMVAIFAPWHSALTYNLQQWRDVLRMTDPDQTVMDLKGELIFRPRPYYYVVETFTSKRIHQGLLKDDIPEQMIARGTCVANHPMNQGRMPARTGEFIKRNYVSVGTLLVAGKVLERTSPTDRIEFEIELPAQYSLVSASGPATGLLDNEPVGQTVLLKPGRHFYQPRTTETKFALVWSQALERGFWPVKIVKRNPQP